MTKDPSHNFFLNVFCILSVHVIGKEEVHGKISWDFNDEI